MIAFWIVLSLLIVSVVGWLWLLMDDGMEVLTSHELRLRLAAAYRAGWDDKNDGTPFSHGYWITQSLPPVANLPGDRRGW